METITTREMRVLELNSEYFGVSRLQLMENAGKCIAEEIISRFSPKKADVAIFCGLGGNGGDGLVAARHLVNKGFKVTVIIAGKTSQIKDENTKKNWQAIGNLQEITTYEVYDSSLIPDLKAQIIIDALLGIGLTGPPRPPIRQLVRKINRMKGFKIAVDVPTGIDSDTGKILGEAVKADLTVTFHKEKLGLRKAKEYTGEITVKDIGLPRAFENRAGPGDVTAVKKPRQPTAHKGDFGRLLIIGGSETYTGAPALVALAALRAGVDLALITAPEGAAYTISSMSPNLITIKLEGEHLNLNNLAVIRAQLESATAVVVGPGLGLHKETKTTVKRILDETEALGKPVVLDADGLKAFAECKRKLKTSIVLTPHAGEYRILTRREPPSDLIRRAEEVKRTASKLGAVILLKGNVDVISDGKRTKLNVTGNPGMTVGGTGDVLSGIIGALVAQGSDPFEAAVAGAFINGACGDFAVQEKGYHITATDLIRWIPKVMEDPMSHAQVRRP